MRFGLSKIIHSICNMNTIIRDFSDFSANVDFFKVGVPVVGSSKKTLPLENPAEIQTARLCLVEDVDLTDETVRNSYLKVSPDSACEEFKAWSVCFDDWVIDEIVAASEQLWGKQLSEEAVRELYRPTVSIKNNLKVYWPRRKSGKIKVRNVGKNNTEIAVPDGLSQGTQIVSILRCRHINIYKSQIWPQWEMQTFVIKDPRKVKAHNCIIDDDTDSDGSYYGDN